MLKVLDRAREDNVEAADDAGLTLDEVAREGARRMLAAALEAKVEHYIEEHADARDAAGRRLVVRNDRAQSRTVTCGAGTLQVRAPRVNDRRVDDAGERRRFTSRILPPYMRRSRQVAEVLPVLYLRGLSTGDFREALPVLLGENAAGLSATNITRLTAAWSTRRSGAGTCRRATSSTCGSTGSTSTSAWKTTGCHAGDARGAVGRHQGAGGHRGRLSGECRELVERAAGPESARTAGAGDGGRRRRARLLVGGARRLAGDDAATRLVPQDGQRTRQAAQAPSAAGETGAARGHVCGDAGRRGDGRRCLR